MEARWFPRARWLAVAVALGGSQLACVSSTTWSRIHEAETRVREDETVETSTRADEASIAVADCDGLADLVVTRWPGLDAPRHRARAAVARARAEAALPATALRFEVWDFPVGNPQLANREGMYMFGLAQELPPAGALDGRARAAAEEAWSALAVLADTRRDIRARAGHACADRAAAALDATRLRSLDELLVRMRDAVLARAATSAGSLSEIARLDAERARTARRITDAEARSSAGERTLLALVGSDASIPPLAIAADTDVASAAVLAEHAASARGVVLAAHAEIGAAHARADAADAVASVPSFEIGAQYMQTPDARAGLGLMLTARLPWLSGAGAASEAARAEALASEADALAAQRMVRVEVAAAYGELLRARRALAALRGDEREATARALDAVTASFATREDSILDWLEAARAVNDLDVTEVELLAAVAHARVDLESALGSPLADVGIAAEAP